MTTRQTTASSPRLHCEPLEDRWVPATLTVDDDGPLKPSRGQYTSIQAAVNAAQTGDKIVVAPGTYREQITIPANKDGLTLVSDKSYKAVIQAPVTLAGALPSLVRVAGADDITIKGFTVRGLDANGAGKLYTGVQVDGGGSATIKENRILDIRGNPLSGVQSGYAVDIEGFNPADPTVARIEDNEIRGYQKEGVAVFGPGAKGTVVGNEIEGRGPTGVIAQNGIDISNGASAVVRGNTVTDNFYTGSDTFAAGIIVFGAGAVSVSGNELEDNQTGVDVEFTTGVEVSGNEIQDGQIGISLFRADGALVLGNDINDLDIAGILVGSTANATFALNRVEKGGFGVVLLDSDNNTILGNVIRKNDASGLALDAASTGNTILLNDLTKNGDGTTTFDADDASVGTGTAGTANTWRFNRIGTSQPAGLR